MIPKTGVYIPLYIYPRGSGWTHWQKVIDARNAHPSVPIIVAINPSNGVGSYSDVIFERAIKKLKASGVVVLGYVYTSWGARNPDTIKGEIRRYKIWYKTDGIMFDEMSNKVGYENYYRDLVNYAKSWGMKFTKGNPGTDVPKSYVGTVDNLVIEERSGMPALTQLAGWHTKYDKRNFSYCTYGVPTLNRDYVLSTSKYVGLIYMTDDKLPNPYDTLPPYFKDLVATLDVSES